MVRGREREKESWGERESERESERDDVSVSFTGRFVLTFYSLVSLILLDARTCT